MVVTISLVIAEGVQSPQPGSVLTTRERGRANTAHILLHQLSCIFPSHVDPLSILSHAGRLQYILRHLASPANFHSETVRNGNECLWVSQARCAQLLAAT